MALSGGFSNSGALKQQGAGAQQTTQSSNTNTTQNASAQTTHAQANSAAPQTTRENNQETTATSQQTTQLATVQSTTQAQSRIIRSSAQSVGDNGEPSVDDQKMLAEMNRRFGTQAKTLDELQALINGQGNTPQDQQTQNQAYQKELLDEFLTGGRQTVVNGQKKIVPNTLDDWYRIQAANTMADIDIVRSHHRTITKTNNPDLTDEQVDSIFNQKYFVNSKDITYEAPLVAYGEGTIKADAEVLRRQQAMGITLAEQSLQAKKNEAKDTREWHAEVDEWAKTQMPTKLSFEFGKVRNIDLGTYEFDLSEQDRNFTMEVIKNPSKILQLFTDPTTKKVDKTRLAEFIFMTKAGKQAMKTAALEYYSLGVDTVQTTLNNEPDLSSTSGAGTGGSTNQAQAQSAAEKKNVEVAKTAFGSSSGFQKSNIVKPPKVKAAS